MRKKKVGKCQKKNTVRGKKNNQIKGSISQQNANEKGYQELLENKFDGFCLD